MKQIKNSLTIGTHNGIFHSDEIVAISILKLLVSETNIEFKIIRSRNIEFLKANCNLLIDIGGGIFDHHQKGGNGKRTNGISYASAGLIWKEFGNALIQKLSKNKLNTNETNILCEVIDSSIIQQVDKEDNGEGKSSHPFKFIESFLPNWNETLPNYDKNFNIALHHTSDILKQLIKKEIYEKLGSKELKQRLKMSTTKLNNILIIPSQTIPWTKEIISYNNKNPDETVDFVIFPYPDGGFALQCVPYSLEDKFSQRIPMPDNWAGETEKLPIISGIKSAVLCHKGRFFARTKNIKDAILMCQIATHIDRCNRNNNDNNISRKKTHD